MVGCATTMTDRELKTIHYELKREFGEDASIRVAPGKFQKIFYVTFENSNLNNSEPQEQSKRAQSAATLVRKNFTGLLGADEIWVTFLKIERAWIFLNYVEQVAQFRFDRNGRRLRTSPTDLSEADPLKPRATYIENAGQTDVALRMQLEGTPGKGLTLIPHFTVAGNAEEQKVKAPDEVSFDFASYSHQRQFPESMKTKFSVDGKTTWETAGKVSTYPADDGTFSEFCYIKMPYKTFRQLTPGKVLSITLGKKEYYLTPEQTAALARMSEFVQE
jgi:hypothetical protein